jgi:hypothetical protein
MMVSQYTPTSMSWLYLFLPCLKEGVAAQRDFGKVGTKVLYWDVALRFNNDGAKGAARVAGHPKVNTNLDKL